MKKWFIFLIMLIVVFGCTGAYCEENPDIGVMYHGQSISFDTKPYYSDGRIMAPVRAIFETLGASVEWDEATSTATSVLGDTTVTMTLGENTYTVNGNAYTMDSAVEMNSDRIFAPVRYVAQSFGKKISYHESSEVAVISEANEYSWYSSVTEPVPDFLWTEGTQLLGTQKLDDGTTEYTYICNESALSDYLNYLQLDFGYSPYGMQYITDGVSYTYLKGDLLIGISEITEPEGEHKVKIVPDVYGYYLYEEAALQEKAENENPVLPELPPEDTKLPLDENVPETEDEAVPKSYDITYDDVDYGKITGAELVDIYKSKGNDFYIYRYDLFSETYYERYVEANGWIFYDYKLDIDTFSNVKYWVKDGVLLSMSVNHIYNIVMVSVSN